MTPRLEISVKDTPFDMAEVAGVDFWLDCLESNLIALSQRRMTEDQMGRLGRLLAKGDELAQPKPPKKQQRRRAA